MVCTTRLKEKKMLMCLGFRQFLILRTIILEDIVTLLEIYTQLIINRHYTAFSYYSEIHRLMNYCYADKFGILIHKTFYHFFFQTMRNLEHL